MPRRPIKKPEVPDTPEWDTSKDGFIAGVMTSHEEDEERMPGQGNLDVVVQNIEFEKKDKE